MSALDTLIQMKTITKRDDLMRLFDEYMAWEKLSKRAAINWESDAVKRKLPLLTKAQAGDIYSQCLVKAMNHILTFMNLPVVEIIEEELPSKKEQRKKEIIESTIVSVEYRSLWEYDPEKDEVLQVLIEEGEPQTAILIIVRNRQGYLIYQGHYQRQKSQCGRVLTPFVQTEDGITIRVETYSPLGNNAYPFGTIIRGTNQYSIWMPTPTCLELYNEFGPAFTKELTEAEHAKLRLAQTSVKTFAAVLLNVIKKGWLDE